MKKLAGALLALISMVGLAQAPALAARVDMTPITPVNLANVTANSADMTFTAADATNYQQVTLTGREVIYAWNTDASNPYTVTFTSVADPYGRTGDITTYSLSAGEIGRFGPFPVTGWAQTNGKLYFQASNAAIKFCVVRERL